MPQCTGHARARRKKLFARISSTFIKNKSDSNSSILESGKMLHSKSTYFYNDDSRINYVVPSICALALLIGGIITISPILNNVEKANAEDGIMATSDTSPTISINLAAGGTSASRRTPAKAGEVTYRTDVFTIGGTGMSKYVVSLNTPSGKTGELAGKSNPYATVGKVANYTVPADFAENTWGYAITNDNTAEKIEETLSYNPVPSGMDSSRNSVEIASRAGIDKTTTVADSYKIVFAANLGKNLPADDYVADVYLSVVTSPQATISDIITMQEMDSNVCAESYVGETKQLIDARKDASGTVQTKKYWVAKLADNNCWMTQNLDFDIPATLSEVDSDVTGTNVATSISSPTAITGWPGSGNTENRYNDPGDYYYNGPDSKHSQDAANSCTNVTSFTDSKCSLYKSINPSDTSADNQKNMHYHIGNYYTWDAATVKSRTNTAGDSSYNAAKNAPMSICPKGWQLPTSNNMDSKSFAGLLKAYNMASAVNAGTIESTEAISINGAAAQKYQIYNDPLYFVYGGYPDRTKLNFAGNRGFYWSSTPYSSTEYTYALYFNDSVSPSSGTLCRYYGFSVRCVAQ